MGHKCTQIGTGSNNSKWGRVGGSSAQGRGRPSLILNCNKSTKSAMHDESKEINECTEHCSGSKIATQHCSKEPRWGKAPYQNIAATIVLAKPSKKNGHRHTNTCKLLIVLTGIEPIFLHSAEETPPLH